MSTDQIASSLKPSGALTIAEVAEFRSMLVSRLVQDGPVIVDLSAVDAIDTAGLQVLAAAKRTGRLTIEQANESVRKTAQAVGLQMFESAP